MEEKRELKPEELEKVVGGGYYGPEDYMPHVSGSNHIIYSCDMCGFESDDELTVALHMSQNAGHNMVAVDNTKLL